MSQADPLIVALLQRLPAAGAPWPIDDRCRWLQACEAILNVVYGPVEKIDIDKFLQPETVAALRAPGTIFAVDNGDDAVSEVIVPGTASSADESDLSPPKFDVPNDKIVIEPKVPPLKPVAQPPAKSVGRPDNIPSNLAMAIEAIGELGPSSAPQIRNWVRKKYWLEAPDHWSASLYDQVSAGHLARSGMNFVVSATKVPTTEIVKPEQPPAKPELPIPKPAAPAGRPPKPDISVGFNHNGKSTVLASSREYVLAGKLRAVMGQHISEAFLSQSILGMNTESGRDRMKAMALGLNGPLAEVGLKVEHYPGFGLIMKEVQ